MGGASGGGRGIGREASLLRGWRGGGTLVSEVQPTLPEFLIFQYLMNLVPGSRRVPSGRFSSRNKAAIVGTKEVCESPGPLVSSVQSIVENSPGF